MISRSMVRWTLGAVYRRCRDGLRECQQHAGQRPRARARRPRTVTWSDGKPAISINCDAPGGCQTRAVAMCKGPNYTVLNMENMPTRGDMTMVRGPASVVIRCA